MPQILLPHIIFATLLQRYTFFANRTTSMTILFHVFYLCSYIFCKVRPYCVRQFKLWYQKDSSSSHIKTLIKRVISCRCREIYISLPHITIKPTLMKHGNTRKHPSFSLTIDDEWDARPLLNADLNNY